ncbi:LysR family transcriptional regulator [Streptomyces caniscabiei]|uniref:LysR family transcriptional regulator n=2 Tax=Streptomyces caniscabiei TaxID=2746961 RepID=A0ABU4MWX8_9ACTN|nr:LysR substrate-binding domain-containing protein [Streptomyces caniscabiei]MBE4740817.1 LysR family transcriptional regulator [Streptomyces caniscabiei]MBE4760629.1 LysR family transcriptional regulator [Streptomyces caniscabiei]MBE4774627.1 LysR family transcriptional regulator [Streptomyces caniscabiei]MBE4788952.1 LysR family transcriptional regulator [Streptomyces caniscabiei]MBE4798557.1 LysR family transcriptional regulator [Streptomyces caniscabiei]
MKFDLHRMRLLRELAQRGTVTSVAAALAYSPSAVSQQLAVLEEEIGTRLFEPDGRRIRLTEQAHILVAHTATVLEQLERAETDILASLDTVVGTIRLATIQTAALALVPATLTSLAEDHPGLQIQLTQAEPEVALPGLLAREFDLVCGENYVDYPTSRSSEMNFDVVAEDPIRVAFLRPPEGREPDEVALVDLVHSPWVLEPEGSPGRDWAMAACRQAGFEPRVAHETPDVLVQAQLVASGHAAAFLPDLTWFGREPTFHLRQMSASHVRQIVTTCRAGSHRNPALVAVRDALRDAYRHSRPSISDR